MSVSSPAPVSMNVVGSGTTCASARNTAEKFASVTPSAALNAPASKSAPVLAPFEAIQNDPPA